jgi:hypothetical protein
VTREDNHPDLVLGENAKVVEPIHVISLGAGVQSSTMALMAAHGQIAPMPQCAIFADTQGEPRAVYDWLGWLEKQLPFPVHRVSRGSLWEKASTPRMTRDGERSYHIPIGIPVYTVEGLTKGIGKRQCTRTFKVDVINAKVRELLGLRRVTKKHGVLADMWIGISADEADRMKPSQKPWIRARWPLLELGMTRADCFAWMTEHGYAEPPRSACTFCPFRDDDSWLALTPEEFADAVEKEKQLQAAYADASAMRSVPYFHDSRVPLSEVKLVAGRPDPKRDQLTLFKFRNECEGMCGV